MEKLTFYGEFTGWWSYAYVCRELAHYLKDRFELRVCDFATGGWGDTENYYGVEGIDRLEEKKARDVKKFVGVAKAGNFLKTAGGKKNVAEGIGLFFGFPQILNAVPTHERNVAYVVCDVDRCPSEWSQTLNMHADMVLTPSAWSKASLIYGGVTKPVHVVRHGVNPCFTITKPEVPSTIRFFSSSKDGVRKGFPELLRAIDILVDLGVFPLKRFVVHSPYMSITNKLTSYDWGYDVDVVSEQVGHPKAMADLWNRTGLLLCPSRCEGFGLMPLEALCCGVPVVAPVSTGMTEFLGHDTRGLFEVTTKVHENLYPKLDGKAPTIDVEELAAVIAYAIPHMTCAASDALLACDELREKWLWSRVLEEDDIVGLLSAS